ncbi:MULTISPECIES: c-type cytochrome biogenesis protein CcsB [Protofrankia]|uniref:Cytochrome c-type biogenesis protein CcsB n=1 Tax=Candidatus Protofrankia datiscae TaxID=2716812 RepID=F8AVJ4_9ACTN|nr:MULTISPECIES: c-type cytochrome biogenesis protein CcsB [Protofrankia]AEH11305.1 cytochrome c-type biogenesis protein CcsB [Candidatus Protofrankia datiscae]
MPVNSGLATLSDHLLGVTMAVYALAMLGYAAEFAFSRFGRASATALAEGRAGRSSSLAESVSVASSASSSVSSVRAATVTTPGRVASMVGADVAGTAAAGVDVAGASVTPAVNDRDPVVDPAAEALAAADARAVRQAAERAAMAEAMAGDGADLLTSPRARWLGRAAVLLTALGCAAHVGSVTARGLAADRVPWGNMYEFSSMITLVAVLTYLGMLARTRARVRWLGVFVMLPVVLYLGLAGTVLYVAAGPLVPALNSYWLKIHVVAAIVASGVFMVSAVTTVLYLLKDRWENRLAAVATGQAEASAAMRRRGGIMMRLPTAASLDRITYRVIGFAFPVWTFAVVAGAIWAEAAWGRYWGWDPKETWSFITWVIYAAYLHARATAGWKGRRAAAISLLGFSALFVDYYLVNLVISGLHSYAGVGG